MESSGVSVVGRNEESVRDSVEDAVRRDGFDAQEDISRNRKENPIPNITVCNKRSTVMLFLWLFSF
jgi:hypothetical protein